VNEAAFDAFCLGLPGAVMNSQWEGDRVYKIAGKMFAVLGSDGGCSFKANDVAFEMLTTEGPGRPAPYLARAKWVKLDSPDALPATELQAYLAQAHGLVAAKLTRAQRRELGLEQGSPA
jgi:predicted DNA-binding protein (MmcQ/YjbR family)